MIVVATAAVVLVLAGLFYIRPAWGIYTALALLPLDRIGTYALNPETGHPIIRPALLAAAACVLAYGLRLLTGRDKLELPVRPYLWLVLLAAWAAVPVILIGYTPLYKDYLSAILVMSFCWIVAAWWHRLTLEKLALALALPAMVVGLFGIYQFVGDSLGWPASITAIRPSYSRAVFGFPRIHSTGSEPLFYANYLLLPFFFCLGLVLAGRAGKVVRIALPIIGLNLLMTTSRGAYIGAIAGIAAIVLIGRARAIKMLATRRNLVLGLAVVAAAASLLMFASYRSHGNPFTAPALLVRQSTSQFTGTGSLEERLTSWNMALATWSSSPITGVGIGGYGYKLAGYPDPAPLGRVAVNNEVLELLVEVGLLGLLLVALFVGGLLRKALTQLSEVSGKDRLVGLGLLGAVVAMLVQYQTFSGFYVLTTWSALGLLGGWAGTNHKRLEAGT